MDVALHGEAAGALFVVPMKVNIGVPISFPVSGDGEVLFESGKELFGLEFLHILNSEIIDYKLKEDRSPLV